MPTQRDIFWPPEERLAREVQVSRTDARRIARERSRRRRHEMLWALAWAIGATAAFWLLAWAVGY